MSQHTCSVEDCHKLSAKRGWCSMHYARWRKTGALSRKCISCGSEIVSNNGGSEYCSESCKTCSVQECSLTAVSSRFCEAHYRRSLKWGSPAKPCSGCGSPIFDLRLSSYCSSDCRPHCSVLGCSGPVEGQGLCKPHYHAWYKGRAPESYEKPTPVPDYYTCISCGKDYKPWGQSRKCCSPRCSALYERYGDEIPSLDFDCIKCGKRVERDRFSARGMKPNRSKCGDCMVRQNNYELYKIFYSSPKSRFKNCALCGEGIDRSLKWPHPLSRSVDHIVPVSKGGSDELENLQLAHLRCNQSKNDRLDHAFQIALEI